MPLTYRAQFMLDPDAGAALESLAEQHGQTISVLLRAIVMNWIRFAVEHDGEPAFEEILADWEAEHAQKTSGPTSPGDQGCSE